MGRWDRRTLTFNPRPPLLAGDACFLAALGSFRWRFNPRPPLLAGDASVIANAQLAGVVSIRARHCWRAMPATASGASAPILFQSAPAIAGGRCAHLGP